MVDVPNKLGAVLGVAPNRPVEGAVPKRDGLVAGVDPNRLGVVVVAAPNVLPKAGVVEAPNVEPKP